MNPPKRLSIIAFSILIGFCLSLPAAALPGLRFIRQLFTGGEPEIATPRADFNQNIPYIISPRKTAILTPAPHFEWNSVPTASQYTVTLRGPSGIVWQVTTENNEIIYSGPLLEHSIKYALIIDAEVHEEPDKTVIISSTLEGPYGLFFYILSQEEIERLSLELSAADDSELDLLNASLERVRIYRDYNLLSNAISLLEELKNQNYSSALMFRILGEIYLQTGLNSRSYSAFSYASDLAVETGDFQQVADINAFLAYLALARRDVDEAIRLLNHAKNIYSNLGSDYKVEEVVEWLEILEY